MHDWNNLQYASSAAFLLAVYSNYLNAAKSQLNCPEGQIQPQELLSFAKSQVCISCIQELIQYSISNPLHILDLI